MSVTVTPDTAFKCTCLRCTYTWPRRTEAHLPKNCPRCKSYLWNIPAPKPTKALDKAGNGTRRRSRSKP